MIETKGIPKNMSAVYEIKCLVNGAVYIGQTKDYRRRIREHKYSLMKGTHRNKQMQADYDEFGADQFSAVVLFSGSDNMDELELECIQSARNNGICYNVFSGGTVGYTANQAFRNRISEVHKGRVDSDETRRRKAESARRQWQNKEYRDLMVQSVKNQWKNSEYRQIMHDTHTGRSDACGHKLTADNVLEMRKRYKNGETFSALAKEFGVSYCTGRSAVLGESWKNI